MAHPRSRSSPLFLPSPAAPEHLDVEIADLLAQRVAGVPEEIGGANLVAAGRRQRDGQQRVLDLAQNPMIEPRRRQLVAEACEIGCEVPLDRGGKVLLGARLLVGGDHGGARELGAATRGGGGAPRSAR